MKPFWNSLTEAERLAVLARLVAEQDARKVRAS